MNAIIDGAKAIVITMFAIAMIAMIPFVGIIISVLIFLVVAVFILVSLYIYFKEQRDLKD